MRTAERLPSHQVADLVYTLVEQFDRESMWLIADAVQAVADRPVLRCLDAERIQLEVQDVAIMLRNAIHAKS